MIKTNLKDLLISCPYISYYLDDFEEDFDKEISFEENLRKFPDYFFEQRKMSREEVAEEFETYIRAAQERLHQEIKSVTSVTILPGRGKDGTKEIFDPIEIRKGEMVAIVGETGSGKSRLLEDIEWQAMGDTPTGRTVLIDGMKKTEYRRKGGRSRAIAQLSQNMNFVLDMNVGEFLTMHAECFLRKEEIPEKVQKVYDVAASLAGETFSMDTAVTALSGGQSRALMIADCAFLSRAPIVLIDEIENAGIDRRRAMDLLTGNDKIVLIATHDPILSLMAPKRITIRNGGISSILLRDEQEEAVLLRAEKMDHELMILRNAIRRGERISI
ncbi:MAG: ATP-binding cassette domain-containing protein [Clostridiales bacterium]|nr:ATP-binding cassette domain-containing protein [Clostridiales bacterium]